MLVYADEQFYECFVRKQVYVSGSAYKRIQVSIFLNKCTFLECRILHRVDESYSL